ncbi:PTS sugar transporter subunit IIC [Lactobacillus gallinarum]|uniref:PTS sugar transporter subunit IIC n=1 Tax=Lactobacillus gallinarum TaxID=52242 RepID=UPI003D1617EA
MRKDFKENLLNILNGVSSGVVIALVPGALINELMKGMSSFWPGTQEILTMTTLMQNLLAAFAGLCVSYLLKFNLIQSGSVAAAAMIASGAFEMKNGHIMLNGSGGCHQHCAYNLYCGNASEVPNTKIGQLHGALLAIVSSCVCWRAWSICTALHQDDYRHDW